MLFLVPPFPHDAIFGSWDQGDSRRVQQYFANSGKGIQGPESVLSFLPRGITVRRLFLATYFHSKYAKCPVERFEPITSSWKLVITVCRKSSFLLAMSSSAY